MPEHAARTNAVSSNLKVWLGKSFPARPKIYGKPRQMIVPAQS